MFARLSSPTNPAAAAAPITPGNISWIIGDAWPSTPIPAVTLRQSTAQSSQNCLVLIASSTCTSGAGGVRRARRRTVAASRLRARRLPSRRRQPHGEHAEHHEDEIDRAHRDERLRDAGRRRRLEVRHQRDGERRADHRTAAEAHDREAGRHARAVGEPLDERRDRRDVAEAEADAADHAVAEIDDPDLVDAARRARRRGIRPRNRPPRRTSPCAGRPPRASDRR